jgi:TorA maturation chaperone TorD
MSGDESQPSGAIRLEPEDLARANLYALVSRLFYAPADANLLAEISQAEPASAGDEVDDELIAAWRVLQEACRDGFPARIRLEYDSLFVGVGKAEVTPYLSAYAEPSSPDRYLVRLREELAARNLVRRAHVFEVEDHVSGVSDVMRWLIENGSMLEDQRRFFNAYVYTGAAAFLAAVQRSASADFYQPVAAFASAFFEIEKAAFEMADTS